MRDWKNFSLIKRWKENKAESVPDENEVQTKDLLKQAKVVKALLLGNGFSIKSVQVGDGAHESEAEGEEFIISAEKKNEEITLYFKQGKISVVTSIKSDEVKKDWIELCEELETIYGQPVSEKEDIEKVEDTKANTLTWEPLADGCYKKKEFMDRLQGMLSKRSDLDFSTCYFDEDRIAYEYDSSEFQLLVVFEIEPKKMELTYGLFQIMYLIANFPVKKVVTNRYIFGSYILPVCVEQLKTTPKGKEVTTMKSLKEAETEEKQRRIHDRYLIGNHSSSNPGARTYAGLEWKDGRYQLCITINEDRVHGYTWYHECPPEWFVNGVPQINKIRADVEKAYDISYIG